MVMKGAVVTRIQTSNTRQKLFDANTYKPNSLTPAGDMGHMEVDVEVGDVSGGNMVRTRALVDTGATFTVVPEKMARELGLKLTGEKVKVATAKGPEELPLSHALLRIDRKERMLPVLISSGIQRVLVGVIALEAMQLSLNPVTEKLEEHTALLY